MENRFFDLVVILDYSYFQFRRFLPMPAILAISSGFFVFLGVLCVVNSGACLPSPASLVLVR
jgi:hypothetical protein